MRPSLGSAFKSLQPLQILQHHRTPSPTPLTSVVGVDNEDEGGSGGGGLHDDEEQGASSSSSSVNVTSTNK